MPVAIMIDTIRTIDEIFIQIAEAAAPALPLDDVVEEMWTMLARGDIRLGVDGGRLQVELLPPGIKGRPRVKRPERMRLARAHSPIIAARLRVLEGQA